jgi:hypothetical protein
MPTAGPYVPLGVPIGMFIDVGFFVVFLMFHLLIIMYCNDIIAWDALQYFLITMSNQKMFLLV